MSLSRPIEKHVAPPVIGPLDFIGQTDQVILIEHDEDDHLLDLIHGVIDGKVNLWLTPRAVLPTAAKPIDGATTAVIYNIQSISRVHQYLKGITSFIDSYVIERIDEMNLSLSRASRGAQMTAFVSMLASPKILRGGNLILSSCHTEYALRGIANQFLNLRKK